MSVLVGFCATARPVRAAGSEDRLILLFSKNCDDCAEDAPQARGASRDRSGAGSLGSVVGRQSGAATLVVLERWGEHLVSRHLLHATYGKREGAKENEGDLRTPEGLYRTVEIHLHPGDDRFGEQSVLLDYPNADDVKNGRTGGYISIHGGRERPTLGCIRVLDEGSPTGTSGVVHRRAIADVARWVYLYGSKVSFLSVPRAHPSCLPTPGYATSRECARAIDELLAAPEVPSREVVAARLSNLLPARPLLASARGFAAPPPPRPSAKSVAQPIAAASVTATSSARTCRHGSCAPAHVTDGDAATAWCEGAAGDGVGERLDFALGAARRLARVEVKNGYWRGGPRSAGWTANGRATSLRITAGDRAVTCAPGADPARIECDLGGVVADRLSITLAGAAPGRRYHDTCLSDVRLLGTAP